MSKLFNELRKKMAPVAQKIVAEKTKQILEKMRLQELRQVRQVKQEKPL